MSIYVFEKQFQNSRETHYECVAQSQALAQRAPITVVSLAVKINDAMRHLAAEKSIALKTADLACKQSLLSQIFSEVNKHGSIGLNSSYQLTLAQRTCVENLLLHSDIEAMWGCRLCACAVHAVGAISICCNEGMCV